MQGAKSVVDEASVVSRLTSVQLGNVTLPTGDLSRACLCIPGDLKKSDFCDSVVDQTIKRFGKLDILVPALTLLCFWITLRGC